MLKCETRPPPGPLWGATNDTESPGADRISGSMLEGEAGSASVMVPSEVRKIDSPSLMLAAGEHVIKSPASGRRTTPSLPALHLAPSWYRSMQREPAAEAGAV